jgi:hypothetical protein
MSAINIERLAALTPEAAAMLDDLDRYLSSLYTAEQ